MYWIFFKSFFCMSRLFQIYVHGPGLCLLDPDPGLPSEHFHLPRPLPGVGGCLFPFRRFAVQVLPWLLVSVANTYKHTNRLHWLKGVQGRRRQGPKCQERQWTSLCSEAPLSKSCSHHTTEIASGKNCIRVDWLVGIIQGNTTPFLAIAATIRSSIARRCGRSKGRFSVGQVC